MKEIPLSDGGSQFSMLRKYWMECKNFKVVPLKLVPLIREVFFCRLGKLEGALLNLPTSSRDGVYVFLIFDC